MKFSNSISRGLLFFALIFIAQISFGQNPTIINDSLIVKQRLYAKEKLIVDKDATFKQAVNVTGASRLSGDFFVTGASKLSGTVTIENLGSAGTLSSQSEFIIIESNGQLKKGDVTDLYLAIANSPLSLDYCGANGGVAQWWAGVNKLFTACPDVKVGIRTDDPFHALHVVGVNYAQKFLAGNSGGTTNAIINGFAQNNTDDLLDLGVKIGGTAIENRFRIKNDGTVFAKELRIRTVADFPDYVFEDDYNLISISELAEYIKNNKHLPNMPTAGEVKNGGLAVGDVVVKLVEKVEELTLYTIQLKEENELLKTELAQIKSEIEEIKKSLK